MGLVDVLSGPGLVSPAWTAPFAYEDDDLELRMPGLQRLFGMTAKGHVRPEHRQADLEGTIVPAYFFNSLLGNIPLLGWIVSAEKGGGLFAARYHLRGPGGLLPCS